MTLTSLFRRSLLIFALFFALIGPLATSVSARMTYSNGVYTNLCGSGTAATHNSCGGHCNTYSGSCSYPSASVVKYTCDGRHDECRSNESAFSTYQSFSNTSCGKTVQIDVFDKNCRGDDGGWTCGDGNLKDYMVWYSGDCSPNTPNPTPTPTPPAQNTCADYQPVETRFRVSDATWVAGHEIPSEKLRPGTDLDVTCFAKNKTVRLPNAEIRITRPDNTTETKATDQLLDYRLTELGTYSFECVSTSIDRCSDRDSVRVYSAPPKDDHRSVCQNLAVIAGNNQTVPSTVKFQVYGDDNSGDIQRYRVHFGDGTRHESESDSFSHTYEVSGNFTARADIKDSTGRWITSAECEAPVTVRPRSIESHKSDCSDLFILKGNHRRPPTTAEIKVTGYDNKDGIEKYKVDFGNGVVKESDGQLFEQVYSQAGTYTIKGYVRDSNGDWKGGDDSCRTTLYVETDPITKQPDTGAPTSLAIFGLTGGVIGLVALFHRRALLQS